MADVHVMPLTPEHDEGRDCWCMPLPSQRIGVGEDRYVVHRHEHPVFVAGADIVPRRIEREAEEWDALLGE